MKTQNYVEIYPMLLYQPDIKNKKKYRLFKGILRHLWPEEGAVLEKTIINFTNIGLMMAYSGRNYLPTLKKKIIKDSCDRRSRNFISF
jgi:hypothetical protein